MTISDMVLSRRPATADNRTMHNFRRRPPADPLVPYPGRYTDKFQIWVRLSVLHRLARR